MSLIHQLTRKPWLTEQSTRDDRHDGPAFSMPTAKLGLRVFLAVITVVFSLVVVAYFDRVTFVDWQPLPEPWLLWVNTAALILSSAALQWAVVSGRREQLNSLKIGLIGAGVFTVAFVAGQLLAWQQLIALGYFADTNPANAFLYLVTSVHGVHLLGGLVAWTRVANKVWHRGFTVEKLRLSVELCAVYWHYLLVVWLLLFALLLFT